MNKGILLYEGKAKQIYSTENNEKVIMYYKDSATAFNGEKKEILKNKGILNNKISTLIYKYLQQNGIKTHWIETLSEREQLCYKMEIIPLEIIIRNISTGSFSKRFGVEEGIVFNKPVFEMSYKVDELNDPLMNDDHALALEIVTKKELELVKNIALKINELLKDLFEKCNLTLVDFKIELGKDKYGNIVLADEISPDSTRLWEKDTNEKLDKDRFRQNLGNVLEAYSEVLTRLCKALS